MTLHNEADLADQLDWILSLGSVCCRVPGSQPVIRLPLQPLRKCQLAKQLADFDLWLQQELGRSLFARQHADFDLRVQFQPELGKRHLEKQPADFDLQGTL